MRKAIAFAYMLVGLFLFTKLLVQDNTANFTIALFMTLTIASFQAFLFTYALITLIDIEFIKKKKIFWELTIIVIFIGVLIACYISGRESTEFWWIFRLFTLYYLLQLARYTYLFINYFRKYRIQLGNYFSMRESRRLQWVAFAFYSAFGIGILALTMLYTPLWIYVSVQVIMIMFYFLFGIQFINYAVRFQYILPALVTPLEDEIHVNNGNGSILSERSISKREELKLHLLKLLEKDEIFKDDELDSDKVREMLSTNRTYLSQIINQDLNTNFYQLVNSYRIKKAVQIMNDPACNNMLLTDIAVTCGFKNLKAFSTFFKQLHDMSPTQWREKNGGRLNNRGQQGGNGFVKKKSR